jgi:hypothetical protein
MAVVQATRVVDDRMTELWLASQERRISGDEWPSACAATRRAMEVLVDEIRRDVGSPKLDAGDIRISV